MKLFISNEGGVVDRKNKHLDGMFSAQLTSFLPRSAVHYSAYKRINARFFNGKSSETPRKQPKGTQGTQDLYTTTYLKINVRTRDLPLAVVVTTALCGVTAAFLLPTLNPYPSRNFYQWVRAALAGKRVLFAAGANYKRNEGTRAALFCYKLFYNLRFPKYYTKLLSTLFQISA